ncbi:MAG: CPBP family intramembrane glutamic endopeptidase [Elainellaceae cyanobacterium]
MTKPILPEPDIEPLSREQILVAMGITAIVLLIISRLWLMFTPYRLLPLNFSVQTVLIGIGLGIGITGLSSIVYSIWPAYQNSADYYLKLVLQPLHWADLIWLGLLPGLSEELLFRGVLLPTIGLTPFGVVISGLCFGVLHFSGSQQWPYVIWATVIGIVLGYGALGTGSLAVPILAHITTNFVSSCIWKASS